MRLVADRDLAEFAGLAATADGGPGVFACLSGKGPARRAERLGRFPRPGPGMTLRARSRSWGSTARSRLASTTTRRCRRLDWNERSSLLDTGAGHPIEIHPRLTGIAEAAYYPKTPEEAVERAKAARLRNPRPIAKWIVREYRLHAAELFGIDTARLLEDALTHRVSEMNQASLTGAQAVETALLSRT